jgi:hypothetical protein
MSQNSSFICNYLLAFLAIVLFAISVGCSENTSPPPKDQNVMAEDENTPESVYRRFMIANLTGDETAIRPLILEHEDVDVLWQGAYPDEVAAALAQQYQGMEISRVDSPDDESVMLQSSASPIPLAAIKVDGAWRLDASPIIEFRKASNKTD